MQFFFFQLYNAASKVSFSLIAKVFPRMWKEDHHLLQRALQKTSTTVISYWEILPTTSSYHLPIWYLSCVLHLHNPWPKSYISSVILLVFHDWSVSLSWKYLCGVKKYTTYVDHLKSKFDTIQGKAAYSVKIQLLCNQFSFIQQFITCILK